MIDLFPIGEHLPVSLILADPNMAFEMLKGTMTNVLPMILIGGWINWTFAGFITSECGRGIVYYVCGWTSTAN